jgi:hypothetical protein
MSSEGNEPESEPEEASEENSPDVSSPRARARSGPWGGRPTKLTVEVGEKILAAIRGGMMRYEACASAGVSTKTLRNWEKAAVAGDEPYAGFIDELELAQHRAQGELMVRHHAISGGSRLGHDGKRVPLVGDEVAATRLQLEAIQFQLRNGGTRPWAELKKMELTGKNGEPLRGSEVTPEAAAAMVREAFGEQARRELEERENETTNGGEKPET